VGLRERVPKGMAASICTHVDDVNCDQKCSVDADRERRIGLARTQAPVEYFKFAEQEQLWDWYVKEVGIVIDGWPTEKQVLAYMAHITMHMKQGRLLIDGCPTEQKSRCRMAVVCSGVARMANGVWPMKYPGFAALGIIEMQAYWSKIFTVYKASTK